MKNVPVWFDQYDTCSANSEKCSSGRSIYECKRQDFAQLYSLFHYQGGSSSAEETTTFIAVQHEDSTIT